MALRALGVLAVIELLAPGDHLAHAAFITACYASAAAHTPVNPKDAL